MSANEIAFTFDCQGSKLIGIVHLPKTPSHLGVLAVVAGGAQYRAGCCRQLVYMARVLSEQGISVMRFDYRGMGDASGKFRGFQHVEQDIKAALDAFTKAVPGLSDVVLWGGCDAASAILINAWKYPTVRGLVLASPHVLAEQTHIEAVRHHYWKRLQEKSFWVKLFKLRFNIRKTAQDFLRDAVLAALKRKLKAAKAANPKIDNRPFQVLMLEGMEKFNGKVLLVMSGRSLEALEFDEMVEASVPWKNAIGRGLLTRIDLPDADQTFSNLEARDALIHAGRDWLSAWHKK
jgi:exosortase A-associated hydrolase 1